MHAHRRAVRRREYPCDPPGALWLGSFARTWAATRSCAPIFSDTWLGTELWPAARALVSLLEKRGKQSLASTSTVLELGSGTGACGLYAAGLGASPVVCTEGGDDALALLQLMRESVVRNGFASVRVERLDCTKKVWGSVIAF